VMKCVLSLVCAASAFVQVAHGHAYMSWPSSRNFDKCDLWDPQSLNGHCDNCNTDCCGTFGNIDFAQVAHNPTGTYQAGGLLEVETILTTHHMGFMELRICSRPHDVTQECFDEHLLLRDAETAEIDPAPVDESHPGRWYIPPPQRNWPMNAQSKPVGNQCSGSSRDKDLWTRYQWKVRLPADLECDHCVVQLFWVSANSCSPLGFADYFGKSSTESWITSKFGGDSSAWWGSTKSVCLANVTDPKTNGNGAEKFWNCGDIKVTRCTGPSCTTASPATTVTTTAAPPVTTATSTTESAITTTSNQLDENSIQAGDIVFLQTFAGSGEHIDVQGTAVQARWVARGDWQALTIEKQGGGTIRSGDTVFLMSHTGAYVDVEGGSVQARWHDRGAWQGLTIEKLGGGTILSDDVVCFKAHTGKHIHVEGGKLHALWDDCGTWQGMKVQKEDVNAVWSGSSVFLKAHTGNHIDVDGALVQARWNDRGAWQDLIIENKGGRAIFSGDVVFLQAHTGKHLDVEGDAVRANWDDHGELQTWVIEKAGGGIIYPEDAVFLRAHTGRYIDVEGHAVSARWDDQGLWQTLVIETRASRLLTGFSVV